MDVNRGKGGDGVAYLISDSGRVGDVKDGDPLGWSMV